MSERALPAGFERRFYTRAALATALIVFAGSYCLHDAFGMPALPAPVQLHGMVIMLWFALLLQVRPAHGHCRSLAAVAPRARRHRGMAAIRAMACRLVADVPRWHGMQTV